MNVELHVQDGDSSAGKAILGHFPNCEIVQCGNHFAKNHKKRLIELKGMKTFDDKMINRYKVSSKQIKIKCHCEKRHRKGCGCFDDDFVRKAAACFKQSLSSAGMDSRAFADNLMNVATKHYRGIHEWDGGHCDFHRLMVCSCGSCSDPDDLECNGKPYESKYVLTCPFHALAYELECRYCSTHADNLIDPELGKVNTNIVEASHNVLVRFRSKDWNIARLHYEVSTNLGLIQSCMTHLYRKRGPDYHWVVDVLTQMELPISSGVPAILKMLNNKRQEILGNQKTESWKLKRQRYIKRRKVYNRKRRQAWSKTAGKDHDYHAADDGTPKGPKAMSSTGKGHDYFGAVDGTPKGPKGKSRLGGDRRPPKKTRRVDSDAGASIVSNVIDIFGDKSKTSAPQYWPAGSDSELSDFDMTDDCDSDVIDAEEDPVCDCANKAHKRSCILNPKNLGQKHGARTVDAAVMGAALDKVIFKKRWLDIPLIRIAPSKLLAPVGPSASVSDDTFMPPRQLDLTPICPPKTQMPPATIVPSNPLTLSSGRFLSKCSSTPTSTVSDCFFTAEMFESLKFYPTPSSDKVWMQEAQSVIVRYSGVSLVQCQEQVKQVPCLELLPHIRDQVIGDGACLFRAISKSITGTQENHSALRAAMLEFMVCPDNVVAIGRFLESSHIRDVDKARHAVESYIRDHRMSDEKTWGTNIEMSVIAAMFQAVIIVFGQYPSRRGWIRYPPIRRCTGAMQRRDIMIYLYHVVAGNHYDLVIPSLDE